MRKAEIVGRIIARHLQWYKDIVIPHILHTDTAQSSQRSILVNLGVFDVDLSLTQGAIPIHETLQYTANLIPLLYMVMD